jgi:hypothetical protein
VIPSITTTGFNSGCYYVNNGKNHIIGRSAAALSGDRGISLFTPATGGYLNGENGGWLNLLDNYESISFTIQSDDQYNDPSCFKYLALNSDYQEQRPPATGGYQYVGFGGYASTIDITIINMIGSGGTGSTNRWFRVYYSAYLASSQQRLCGVLSTYNSIAN